MNSAPRVPSTAKRRVHRHAAPRFPFLAAMSVSSPARVIRRTNTHGTPARPRRIGQACRLAQRRLRPPSCRCRAWPIAPSGAAKSTCMSISSSAVRVGRDPVFQASCEGLAKPRQDFAPGDAQALPDNRQRSTSARPCRSRAGKFRSSAAQVAGEPTTVWVMKAPCARAVMALSARQCRAIAFQHAQHRALVQPVAIVLRASLRRRHRWRRDHRHMA